MANRMEHLPEGDLSAYLLGQLPDDAQQAVEDHLGECPECEERAAAVVPRDALVELLQRAAAGAVPAAPFSVFGNTLSSRFDATPGDHPSTVISHELAAGATLSPPAALTGHSRYRVLRLLGCGGMGSVWLAEHLVMGRPVALKIIRPELLAKAGTLERFRRELQAAAKLNHPNIAQAYDAEQIGESHFLVMEYVPGHTLSERVKIGPLPVTDACHAVSDAARGLAHAHAAGLVHRDVKPGNLIQTDNGTVKVLDFGLAISAEADTPITGENLVMGTPDYVAPEQAEDPHAADARSDIYSLGCTLYHLLAGRVPFDDGTIVKKIDSHRHRVPPPIENVPRDLWLIVAKMMAKSPEQRFQKAEDVVAALETFCRPALNSSADDVRCEAKSTWPSRRWLAAGVAVILLGFLAFKFLPGPERAPNRSGSTGEALSKTAPLNFGAQTDPTGRHSLLVPSSLGDGTSRNFQVDGQVLKIDTLTEQNQLWMNYSWWQSSQLEVHCQLRFTGFVRNAFFKIGLQNDLGPELNVQIRKEERYVRIERADRNEVRSLFEQRLPEEFGNAWVDLKIKLRGPKVQVLLDNKFLAEVDGVEAVNRYVCLAAYNCKIEVRDPTVIVSKE